MELEMHLLSCRRERGRDLPGERHTQRSPAEVESECRMFEGETKKKALEVINSHRQSAGPAPVIRLGKHASLAWKE